MNLARLIARVDHIGHEPAIYQLTPPAPTGEDTITRHVVVTTVDMPDPDGPARRVVAIYASDAAGVISDFVSLVEVAGPAPHSAALTVLGYEIEAVDHE